MTRFWTELETAESFFFFVLFCFVLFCLKKLICANGLSYGKGTRFRVDPVIPEL